MRPDTVAALAWRILSACFAEEVNQTAIPSLEPFQTTAVHRLGAILSRRGGAILADSVGLGKTHVAVELIRAEVAAGATVVITAPAQLRVHWLSHLRGLTRCRWVSHTSLSRGARLDPPTLVVVDEAHAFRNARTRRYAALALLCEHARVLLVTATPVNNSLLDFYHLVRLFAARDLFMDIGVPDLLAAVESARSGGSAAELRRVADAIMVRRTRAAAAVPLSLSQAAPSRPRPDAQPPLRFPACGPIERITYDTAAVWPAMHHAVHSALPALTFPAHSLSDGAAASALMRLGLLKRLESSSWAFTASVRRHIRVLQHFLDAAADGLLFDVRTRGLDLHDIDGAMQLSLGAVALREWPPGLDRDRLTIDASRDIARLRQLAACVAPLDAHAPPLDAYGGPRNPTQPAAASDPKLARLIELLDAELSAETVLLFTEFQETARGLWRALSLRPGVALVHGSDARLGRGRASRRAIIERFAPLANRCRKPREAERVRLLIATDVLAEGMNLQDAGVVISYDLPWNPVRLAQRVGRIDRLGSSHERVRALVFVPDRGMDEMLGLMKRIRRKLRHIRVVGGDAPWSLGSVRGRRVIDVIDQTATAREHARAAWLEAPAPSCPPGDGPSAAVMSWNEAADGALCAFSLTDHVALVLVYGARRVDIGTARCWTLLREALDCADTRPLDRHMAQAAAHAARMAARAVHRPVNAPDAGATTVHAAAGTVLQWLSSRPGRPAPTEIEEADAVLRDLARPHRAGTELRIEKVIAGATSPGEMALRLRRAGIRSTDSRRDQELSGATPGAIRHDTGAGRAPPPAAPRLWGVLLLKPAAPQSRDAG